MRNTKFLWVALALMLGLVFAGCVDPNGNNGGDAKQFKVTIPNIGNPKNFLWGVSLMTGLTRDTVVATAASMMGGPFDGETFLFYAPSAAGNPELDKPFYTTGEYYIGLSDVDIANRDDPANAFILCDANDQPIKVTFNENTPTHTFQKTEFKTAPSEPVAPEPPAPVVPFKLTIDNLGIPSNNAMEIWGASLMDKSVTDVVAVSVLGENNSFTFYSPKMDDSPDTEKPYNKEGNYFIGLSDVNLDNPTDSANVSLLFKEDGTLARLPFNNTTQTQTVDKAHFRSERQFKVTVTGTAGTTSYHAYLLTDAEDLNSSVAGNTYQKDGIFDFVPVGDDGWLALNGLFTIAGDYYICLSTTNTANGTKPSADTAKILCENGEPKKVTFNVNSSEFIFDLTDFVAVSVQ
jgi:hypothetical protein